MRIVAPAAHYDVETVNVSNTTPDRSLPQGHPVRTTMERGNAFVARDLLPPDLIFSRLYADPQVQQFVAVCFEGATPPLGDPRLQPPTRRDRLGGADEAAVRPGAP